MGAEADREIQQVKNRIRDLADMSLPQNRYTYTGFLGLAQQETFWELLPQLPSVPCELWGGDALCERKILRFGSPEQLGYEEPYPIRCIRIRPLQQKFADDFSHRDFLGALMNLGIDRSTMGDIRVGEREGDLYCLESMAEYICANLEQVKHTRVKCETAPAGSEIPREEPVEIQLVLPSLRADVCLAKFYHLSRGEIQDLFRAGRVYVDGRLCENPSRTLKEGEAVTLRGYGKFLFGGEKHGTKKGKICVGILRYGS